MSFQLFQSYRAIAADAAEVEQESEVDYRHRGRDERVGHEGAAVAGNACRSCRFLLWCRRTAVLLHGFGRSAKLLAIKSNDFWKQRIEEFRSFRRLVFLIQYGVGLFQLLT